MHIEQSPRDLRRGTYGLVTVRTGLGDAGGVSSCIVDGASPIEPGDGCAVDVLGLADEV